MTMNGALNPTAVTCTMAGRRFITSGDVSFAQNQYQPVFVGFSIVQVSMIVGGDARSRTESACPLRQAERPCRPQNQ